jgi:mono/diheme cytochrome c family protein
MFRILFGFVVGIVCIPAAIIYWSAHTRFPVAVTDQPFPSEREIAGRFLHTRISKELIQIPPIQPDEETLIGGARIYNQKCSVCHGIHGRPSEFGNNMYPAAPPLWEKHKSGNAVGVSDDLPGITYWKIANGIRLTGMPEFRTELTDTEIWMVTLLLANADKPLPPDAVSILRAEIPQTWHPKPATPDPNPHPGTLDE